MKTTLAFAMTFMCLNIFAQYSPNHSRQSQPVEENNIERYGYDYIVLNHDFQGDSSILNLIDFSELDQFRKVDENVIIQDPETMLDILLFARKNIGRKGENILID